MAGLENEYKGTISRDRYNNSVDLLLNSILLSCSDIVMECKIGQGKELSGKECCTELLSSGPFLTPEGTCFSSRDKSIPLLGAGEGSGITIITQHDELVYDRDITSPDLLGSQGLSIAVVDKNISPIAAMQSAAFTIRPDSYADVGIIPTRIDDTQLSSSLIGRESCHLPEDSVSSHLNTNQQQFGYSKFNCEAGKNEIVANNKLKCSFIRFNDTSMPRCSPFNSSVFSDSIFGSSESGRPTFAMDSSLTAQMINPLTATLKEGLQSKLSGNVFTFLSETYNIKTATRTEHKDLFYMIVELIIENRPQPALQFVAEVGGIMAFFLGLSIITLIGSNETFMIGDFARPPGPPRNHELDFRERYNRRELGGSYP